MAFPDDIPRLFDDLIDNLDSTTDVEEAAHPVSSPTPLKMDEDGATAHHIENGESSAACPTLSSPDVVGLDTFPTSSAPEGFIRLSEILRETEFPERTYIVSHYEDAVRRGVVQAVMLEGHSFQVRYWLGNSSTRRSLQDELILRTAELEEWLRVQRLESRYAHRAATQNAATTLEHLESGRDDFQRLAKLRRQLLNTKGKEKE